LTVFDLPGHHRHPVRGTLPHRRPPPPRRGAPEPSRRPQAALRRRDTGLSRAGSGGGGRSGARRRSLARGPIASVAPARVMPQPVGASSPRSYPPGSWTAAFGGIPSAGAGWRPVLPPPRTRPAG